MAYLGKTPSQAVRSRYYFTATGGETSLSGADDNANTLTFTDGNYVDVALNGVTLVAGTDYNTTTANTIAGLTALVASDVVEVIVYDTFSVFSGNVNGDFTVGGTLTAASYSGLPTTTLTSLGIPNHDDITVDGSGNVGIGTTTTSYGKFTTQNTAGTGKVLLDDFQSVPTTENVLSIHADASNGYIQSYNNGWKNIIIAPSGGNVGIGTSSPSEELTISKSDDARISITSASTGKAAMTGLIEFDGSDGRHSYIGAVSGDMTINTDGGYPIKFQTTGNERMRIDSSGNLLVGTTDTVPSNNGAGGDAGLAFTPDGAIRAARSGNNPLDINRMDNDGDIAAFRKDGITVGSIAATTRGGATDIFIGSGDTGIYFTQALDAIAPSNQGSDRDNAIDLGRSANRFKDLYLSGGVYLGGTGSANHLDDYEEGTWTMTVTDGTTSKSTTGNTYRKVGNLVFIRGAVGNVEDGGAFSGQVYVSGLPFSSAGVTPISSLLNYMSTSTVWTAQVNASNVYFYKLGVSSTDYAQIQGSDFSYYSDMNIAGCYAIS